MLSKDELIRLINEHKTNKNVAKIVGMSEWTISKWRKKLGISLDDLHTNLPIADQIKNILETGILNIESFSQTHKIDKPEIYNAIEKIEKEGYIIEKSASGYYINKTPKFSDKKISIYKDDLKFGIVSDTHLCSKYQQLTYLEECYDIFEKKGVTDVFNAGDVADGFNVYRGHFNELFLLGGTEQRDYVVSKYPRRKNITTRVIAGNHDLSFFKQNGFNLVKSVAEQRDDFDYLGELGAYIEVGKQDPIKIYLMHPDGGGSYAVSYKPQKIVEGFSSDNKPHILIIGHYHRTEYLFERNVHIFQPGCFQSQTPFLKRKGLYPKVGAWIVNLSVNSGGIKRINMEYFPFYKEMHADY